MSDGKEKVGAGVAKKPRSSSSKSGGEKSSGARAGGGAAAAPVQTGEEAVYQLTRAIQTIAKQRDAFKNAVDTFLEIEKDVEMRVMSAKKRMDEQELARKKEGEERDADVERERKRRRIDLEQDLREFGDQHVLRLLSQQKKVPISAEELDQLRADVDVLRRAKDEAVASAVREAVERAKNELATKLESMQLRHQAEMAAITANRDQQKQQIQVLADTITNLRNELDQQRKLTRDVAYSQAQAQANNRPGQAPNFRDRNTQES